MEPGELTNHAEYELLKDWVEGWTETRLAVRAGRSVEECVEEVLFYLDEPDAIVY